MINKVLFVQDQLRYGFVIEKAQDPPVSGPLSLMGWNLEKRDSARPNGGHRTPLIETVISTLLTVLVQLVLYWILIGETGLFI